MTMYTSSAREEAARQKLYEQVRDLRSSLLDLLTLVRASSDPIGAVTDIAVSDVDRHRRAARDIEHRDHIIRRARAIIDGTHESEKLTGPQR